MLSEGRRGPDEEILMQDLVQDYASDLKKLREAFHSELTATADELSKAIGVYAQHSEAALASLMEKASCSWVGARGVGDGEAQSVLRSPDKRQSAGRR